MKLTTLAKIVRGVICAAALVLAGFAWVYNPGHLFTAAVLFAVGLNVECKNREDRV